MVLGTEAFEVEVFSLNLLGWKLLTPTAKVRRKMLKVIDRIVTLSIEYFSAIPGRPGAIMDELKGDTKLYMET